MKSKQIIKLEKRIDGLVHETDYFKEFLRLLEQRLSNAEDELNIRKENK